MIDIFPQILSELKTKIAEFKASADGVELIGSRTVNVAGEYLYSTQKFPCVTIEEKRNGNAEGEMDFVEKRSELLYEINIYDNARRKTETCRKLAKAVDEYMADKLGFLRLNGEPFPNTADSTVYRYLLRYEGYIDTETGNVSRKI